MRSLDTEPTSSVPEEVDDEENSWDFECMISSKEIVLFGLRGKLQERQRIFADGGQAVFTAVAKEVQLAREGIEEKRKNAAMPERITDAEAKLVEVLTVKSTLRKNLAGGERRMKVSENVFKGSPVCT